MFISNINNTNNEENNSKSEITINSENDTDIKNNEDENIKIKKNDKSEEEYLNKNYILESDLCGDTKKLGNFWYKHLTYARKNFYLMTKKKGQIKANKLYYYCRNHDTTKHSIDGKKHSICDAKIIYYKDLKEYKLITQH